MELSGFEKVIDIVWGPSMDTPEHIVPPEYDFVYTIGVRGGYYLEFTLEQFEALRAELRSVMLSPINLRREYYQREGFWSPEEEQERRAPQSIEEPYTTYAHGSEPGKQIPMVDLD
jgi:hypothetical protein